MKNYLLPLTYIIILISFMSCHSNQTAPEVSVNDKLDAKHGPSEEFFLQRLDPEGNFSIDTYVSAIKKAKEDSQVQTRSMNGFDNEWTVQGPGNIGGRINTIAAHPLLENIMYAGFARGGVFKTTDGGDNWAPIFDDQPFLAIGDICLDPKNANTIYVGTGDSNISGTPSIGDGLYKSEDGGSTWENIGLEETRIISQVLVDPSDSDRIFVAAMGLPFQRNNDRGLYRTENGGDTWEQVLFVSDSTGIIDLVIDPQNPSTLYASGWDRIRNNRESLVSGYGAKVFKTTNSGDTWEVLEGGLPNQVPNGRIGLAICESQPNVLYAQYANPSSTLEAIYRSDDFGANWTAIPTTYANGLSDRPLGGFAWYFGKIRVSPSDPDDIYLLGVDLWRTRNAGQSWDLASPPWWYYEVHADKHDLIYRNDESILLGTDGGMYLSDRENYAWRDIENIPTNQFYRVAYNPHEPNQYYGGAQDNGSTGGNKFLINNWSRIYGGDGFQMAFDPVDPLRFFAETQNGGIVATYDGGYFFDNATAGIDDSDPRNWDMPYIMSVHDEYKMVTGTNRLYVNREFVPNWEPLTDDLTDGPNGETISRNRTITAIHESAFVEDFVVVGTGDGNIWRGNLNNGNSFVKISDGLPDQYVTDVATSDNNPNRIFACHSGYRDNDNTALIFRSDDLGNTWVSIAGNLPAVAINEILIYPSSDDSIIFIATDVGVYGTTDAGITWARLGNNMPITPVYDLVLNEAKNELVAATYGRSIQSYNLAPIVDVDVAVAPPTPSSVDRFVVYPNISKDQITVSYFNIEPNKDSNIAIVSSNGQLVNMIENISDREVEQQIDISTLPAGQYFVKIKVRHSIQTLPFIKE